MFFVVLGLKAFKAGIHPVLVSQKPPSQIRYDEAAIEDHEDIKHC